MPHRTEDALSPPPWPQPHPYAQDFDEFWLVRQVPPWPWPALPGGPIDHQAYGPAGTEWLFPVSDYMDRLSMPGMSALLGTAAKALFDEAQAVKVPLSTTWGWRTPAGHDSPAVGDWRQDRMSIKVLRAVIHAKVGTLEESANVLHFRTQPQADLPMTKADLDTAAPKIISAWGAFLGAAPTDTGGSPIRGYFPQTVVWDELRLSYLTITPGQKPAYDVPTQFYPMTGTVFTGAGGGPVANNTGIPLPNEVALALSFGTHLRGPRHRGRTYLGPLMSGTLNTQLNDPATSGLFSSVVEGIGQRYGSLFLAAIKTNTPFVPQVLSQVAGESYEISGIRVGHVPDSQRRRRRSLPEGYAQVWGSAPGV